MMLLRLKYWLPAICVAILISVFSTHYFSGEKTARVFIPLLLGFFPRQHPTCYASCMLGIRKLAHVTEFGIFSISVFHGIRGGRSGWRFSWALATLVIAVVYAGIDEWHQSFVPLREARARDVAIDALGAMLAQVLVWAYANWRRLHQAAITFGKDIR